MSEVVFIAAVCLVAGLLGGAIGGAWAAKRSSPREVRVPVENPTVPILLAELGALHSQEVRRDSARAEQQALRQGEQERVAALRHERLETEVRELAQKLTRQTERGSYARATAPAERPAIAERGMTAAVPTPPPINLARPPEPHLTPVAPPPQPNEPQLPGRELTDEELDAMPAELPATVARKRILPPPKKPRLNSL